MTDPPPIQYVPIYEPTSGSLSAWARWCQQHLKDLSVKVQGLEKNYSDPPDLIKQMARIEIGEAMLACRVPHAQPRIEALETQLLGQPSGTHIPGSTGGLLARVAALEAAVAPAGSVSLPTRVEQDYANQLKRIRDLEARVDHLELNASEPVADRTRGRKYVKQDRVSPRVLKDASKTWPLC